MIKDTIRTNVAVTPVSRTLHPETASQKLWPRYVNTAREYTTHTKKKTSFPLRIVENKGGC